MPHYITAEERAVIQGFLDRGPNEDGNYSDAYAYIASILPDGDVQLWFRGAEQANAGQGVFSELIRVYSQTQMALRGVVYSDALMQEASNSVAERALADILNGNRIQSDGTSIFPNINDIATNDAVGVGEVLFASLPLSDTAGGTINSGWSGTILFSAFNSDQVGRLLTAGDSFNSPEDSSELNRLDDIKNVLFAYYSYSEAWLSAAWDFGENIWDFLTSFELQLFTDLGVGIRTIEALWSTSGSYDEFFNEGRALFFNQLTNLLPASAVPFGELLAESGEEAVLTWIESSYAGHTLNMIPGADFVTRARDFFTSMSTDELQSTEISILSGSLTQVIELARTSEHVRNALMSLSPIVLERSGYSQDLSVYDPDTGTGNLTDDWIRHRSEFLVWEMLYRASGQTGGELDIELAGVTIPQAVLGDIRFTDTTSGQVYELMINGVDVGFFPTRVISFGGINNDVFLSGDGDDYLFGGAGDDTLTGNTGNDVLEGGTGNDTYIFNYGDGRDSILDTDGVGSIEVQHTLGGTLEQLGGVLTQSSANSSIYFEADADGNPVNDTRYLLVDNGDGTTNLQILVDGGQGGSITLSDFNDGDFGIQRAEYVLADYVFVPDIDIGSGRSFDYGGYQTQYFSALGDSYIRFEQGNGLSYDSSQYYTPEVIADYALEEERLLPWNAYVARPARGYYFYGSVNDDRLIGSGIADVLGGYIGNDRIEGAAGADTLFGGAGSDQVIGGEGNDSLFGGYTLTYEVDEQSVPIAVIDTDIVARDISAKDYIEGGAGTDYISGSRSVDTISGGDDDDKIAGGLNADIINGDAGNDFIYGDSVYLSYLIDELDDEGNVVSHVLAEGFWEQQANDEGLSTNDIIDGGTGRDVIFGEHGADIISGGDDSDIIFGDRNNAPDFNGTEISNINELNNFSSFQRTYFDITQPGDSYSVFVAFPMDEMLVAPEFHGDDTLFGGSGDDYIEGNGGMDIIHGGGGDDQIRGDDFTLDVSFHGDDVIFGESGVDTIWGNAGNDELHGGTETDYLYGGEHNDTIYGGEGNDLIYGDSDDAALLDPGDDVLYGGAGLDFIYGGDGNDVISGGKGDDVLHGDAGDDSFVFSHGDGIDRLVDTSGQTIIHFGSGILLRNLMVVNAGSFHIVYGDGDAVVIDGASLAGVQGFVVNGESYTTAELVAAVTENGAELTQSFRSIFGNMYRDVTQVLGDQSQNQEFNDDYVLSVNRSRPVYGFNTHDSDGTFNIGVDGSEANVSVTTPLGNVSPVVGDARDNIIIGAFDTGNSLNGGEGVDVLWGGRASDTYYVDDENDEIRGEWGNFTDRVNSTAVRYSLDDDLEILSLSGSVVEYGGGNDQSNIILSDAGNGNVILEGGLGEDLYIIDPSNQVVEALGGGHDTVVVRHAYDYTYILPENVEDGKVQGRGAILIGNDADNELRAFGSSMLNALPTWRWGYRWDSYSSSPISGSPILRALQNDVDWSDSPLHGSRLEGGAGDDEIWGGELNDVLVGGVGDDRLRSAEGYDQYIYGLGDGNDTILSENVGYRTDVLRFDNSIVMDDLSFSYGSDSRDLLIDVSDGGSILLELYFEGVNNAWWSGVENIEVIDSEGVPVVLSVDDVSSLIVGAPIALNHTDSTSENSVVSGVVPMATDENGIIVSYQLIDGVSAGTLIFETDGSYQFDPGADFDALSSSEDTDVLFTYTATDDEGIVSNVANVVINVLGENDEPVASDDIATTPENVTLDLLIADLLDNDDDEDVGDSFTISSVSNFQHGFATINSAAGTVTFDPEADFVGTASFDYTVIDGSNAESTATVFITVNENVNSPPEISNPISDQNVDEDSALSFIVPANTFSDADGDVLTLSAQLSSGDPLPSWLNFDSATRAFSGTPMNDDVGVVNIEVFANDGEFTVSDNFILTINNTNDAPVVASEISDQSGTENTAFNFVVPISTFTDVDSDVLTYSAELSNGDPLPAWLSFDAATQTFSGTPDASDVGDITLRVIADDTQEVVSDDFVLSIVAEVSNPGNLVEGTEYDDEVLGTSGDDILVGHLGSDVLLGYEGDDEYRYAAGDGNDVIFNVMSGVDDTDVLSISGTTHSNLWFEQSAGDLLVHIVGYDESIQIYGWFNGIELDQVIVGDYSIDTANVNQLVTAMSAYPVPTGPGAIIPVDVQAELAPLIDTLWQGDTPPTNELPIASDDSVNVIEDTVFTGTVPSAADSDGSIDSYSLATPVSEGTLAFNSDGTYSFTSGTDFDDLAVDETRDVSFTYTATDNQGGESAEATVTITVQGTDDLPVVVLPLEDQTANEGQYFNIQIPGNTFSDPDSILTLQARLANGEPLPNWLNFDASTGVFSGTPENSNVGTYDVEVTASDGVSNSISDTFVLAVNNANDVPVLANPIVDQSIDEDSALSFIVPANTFSDADGDVLTLSAQLSSGDPLPSWLNFDSATRAFSGTPMNDDVGVVNIEVFANDGEFTVSDNFILTINNTNDAPVVASEISDQSGTENTAFNFVVPIDAFTDVDGDVLTYTAELSNGDPLPAWLSFDAATRTFSGTPDVSDVGDITLRVIADDTQEVVSDDFVLSIVAEVSNPGNLVEGTEYDDEVLGTSGNDILVGHLGNDVLLGYEGDDEYRYAAGDGNDVIYNVLSGPDDTDVLSISGTTHSNLWFEQSAGDLLVHIVGYDESIQIYGWFNGIELDQVIVGDYSIDTADVNQLVTAMSAYPVPTGPGAIIPVDVQAELAPLIDTLWQDSNISAMSFEEAPLLENADLSAVNEKVSVLKITTAMASFGVEEEGELSIGQYDDDQHSVTLVGSV